MQASVESGGYRSLEIQGNNILIYLFVFSGRFLWGQRWAIPICIR